MNRAKILREIRILKDQNEATANALTVLEKELSDSGVSGSSSQRARKKHLQTIGDQAVSKRRSRRKKATR